MKVLHVLRDLSCDGGVQRLVFEMATENTAKGEVDVLITNRVEGPEYISKLESLGVNVFLLKRWNLIRIRNLFMRYDIVHAHLFPALYLAAFLARKAVYTEHNTTNNRRKIPFLHVIESYIYSRFTTVSCISPQVQESLLSFLRWDQNKNTKVVYNGVNLKRFKNVSRNEQVTGKNFNIVMVGSLSEQKDQSAIIAALTRLPKNVILHLVGDGSCRTELEVQANRLEVSDRVFFHGVVENVPDFISSMDMYIQSSKWEGFGLAAVEAMASGLPTVCSNVPGLSDLFSDNKEHSFNLFEVGDFEALASLVKRVMEDYDFHKRMIDLSLKTAHRYSLDNMIGNFSEIYNNDFEI